MEHDGFFFQAFIYLTAAVIAVPVAKRLGLGSVLGYLIAGVVIGPFVFGLVGDDSGDVMHFAEFGVVMMLFIVGLELQPSLLWKLRGAILGKGGLQVLLTILPVAGLLMVFDVPGRMALALGMIVALSSTAIVLQTLNEKGLMQTDAGQSSFSVLLFQDIAVIPMLALMPLLAVTGAETGAAPAAHGAHSETWVDSLAAWQEALLVFGVVGGIIVVGRFLGRPIFRIIAETRLREIFTAATLLIVVGIALAMQLVGLSPALGTFVAGVVLAENEYRHELETDIEPFKGLLLGLFFIAVGASINFQLLFNEPLLVLGCILGLVAIKFIVLFSLAAGFKMKASENFVFSFSMAQGGEFAFVLGSFAFQNQVLTQELTQLCMVTVALSMVATPLLMMFNEAVVQPYFADRNTEERETDTIDEDKNPVIVAGFGRFGQTVSRLLHTNGIRTTILDHSASQIDMLREFGWKVFYGDAGRIDLLRSAGAEQAKLLVIAIDQKEPALEMVRNARKHFPHLKILARAIDRPHAYELIKLGVDSVHRETFDSSLTMAVESLKMLGFRAHQAHRLALNFRRYDEGSLHKLAELWGDKKAHMQGVKRYLDELEVLLAEDKKALHLDSDAAWDTGDSRKDAAG